MVLVQEDLVVGGNLLRVRLVVVVTVMMVVVMHLLTTVWVDLTTTMRMVRVVG